MSQSFRRIALALAILLAGSFSFDLLKGSGGGSVLLGMMGGSLIWVLLPLFRGTIPFRTVSVVQRETFASEGIPPAGCAMLYVYRPGYIGMTTGFNATLDGKQLAILKCPRYVRGSLATGGHSLSVGVAGFAASIVVPASVSFEAVAGETIVFSLSTGSSGLQSRIILVREDDVFAAMGRMAAMRRVADQRSSALPSC